MTILVDYEIKEAVKAGHIKVSPYDESLLNPASLDVRLGKTFTRTIATGILFDTVAVAPVVDLSNKETFRFETFEAETYLLHPGDFILGCLLEDITLPPNMCAEIRGKSSVGRAGLDNSSFAGFIDNSWSGVLTLELANHGTNSLLLRAGMKIGQIVFHYTDLPERDYSQTGRYQRQNPAAGSLGL